MKGSGTKWRKNCPNATNYLSKLILRPMEYSEINCSKDRAKTNKEKKNFSVRLIYREAFWAIQIQPDHKNDLSIL